MSYANVINPVVIQATASISAKIDNFVRRFAIVSNGQSILDVGTSKVVYNSDYAQFLKVDANDEIIKKIKGYFTFAGNKELVIIEVGSNGTTKEVEVLENFIKQGENRAYVTLCPDAWYSDKITTSTNNPAIQLRQNNVTICVGQSITINQPNDAKLSDYNVSNSDGAILEYSTKSKGDKRVYTAVKAGNATLTLSGTYDGYETLISFTLNVNVIDKVKSNWVLTSMPTEANLAYDGELNIEYPANMPSDTAWNVSISGSDYLAYDETTKKFTAKKVSGVASVTIQAPATDDYEMASLDFSVNVAETQENPTNAITISANSITSVTNPEQPAPFEPSVSINAVSQTIFNSAFVNLCKQFVSENSARFFMCRITDKINPADDIVWENYKGTKSFFPVYDTLSIDAYALTGSILGKMANSIFEITDTNPASPLNYKQLSGANFVELSESFLNNLTQAPVNYAYNVVGVPIILNGRYADGSAWDYWYQWDTVCLAITQKVSTLLLNGVNNPNSVIAFNQTGIDILESGISSVLEAYKSRGAISDFSKSVDAGTGEMVEQGFITAIPYSEYILANKEKYENEIYDGFSFYLMIGRYIRQVIINVSLA